MRYPNKMQKKTNKKYILLYLIFFLGNETSISSWIRKGHGARGGSGGGAGARTVDAHAQRQWKTQTLVMSKTTPTGQATIPAMRQATIRVTRQATTQVKRRDAAQV